MPDDEVVTDPQTQTEQVKTFTQEEVNGLIAKESKKGLEKALKDLGVEDFKSAKEGLAKLKEYQESQKTESEKLAEQLKALNDSVTEKDKLLQESNTKLSLLSAGIPGDRLDKYTKLIAITDGETLEDKIKQVLIDFPVNVAPASLGSDTKSQAIDQTAKMSADLNKIFGLT